MWGGDFAGMLIARWLLTLAFSFALGAGCLYGCEHFPWRLHVEQVSKGRR